ncbi:lamin tail domain-containing protein [Agreia bicolorata]|uniref:lamin tail domain-containing protein n=1 Tax=Agreia bicolorata TaxID=110935 RepID=UPI0006990F82|nr:lamin tail domain-containing protein [Agreia bicolorata]
MLKLLSRPLALSVGSAVLLTGLFAVPAAASADVTPQETGALGAVASTLRINEIETNGDPDWVELINTATEPLDASGFVLTGRGNDVTLTLPSNTVIAAGAVYVAESSTFKLKKSDKVSLFASDGTTLLDSYEWGDFHLDTYGRVPNGTGDFVQQATPSKGELNPTPTDPGEGGGDDAGWQSVKLNEVTSANDDPTHDAYELVNTGDTDVDVSAWMQSDSTSLPAAISAPNGTVVPAHGYLVLLSNQGLSSSGDSVKVYRADGSTIVDSVGWGDSDAQPGSWSRCADATGAWAHTAASSWGVSNATACAGTIIAPSTPGGGEVSCQTEAASGSGPAIAGGIAWPGSQTPVVSDNQCQFVTSLSGQDVSGLDIDPSAPNVMWAVKNKSHVYRLVKSGSLWVPDTENGWSAGKDIVFPSGSGQPDSEGLTVGPDGFLYITTERDNAASGVPLDSVLRFDPSASGTTLQPTHQWNLTSSLSDAIDTTGKADSNLGFEGITWVPDSYLTTNGFVDQSTGEAYDPADYPGHGTGLYFLALEKNGHLYAYALNADGTFHRLSSIDTGLPLIADTQWDADAQRIWAVADNSVAGSSTLLKMDAAGGFVVDRTYDRPTGLPNNNNEGFAIAPNSTCVDGVKEVIRSDDGNNGGHSLWSGTISCDLALGPQGPNPPASSPTVAATPSTVQAGGVTTIVAAGLVPDTEYTVVLHSEPVTLGNAVADSTGVLTLSNVRIPADTAAGAHTITIAAASDPATIVAGIPFTVTAAAVVPAGGNSTQTGSPAASGTLASTGAQPLPVIAAGTLLLMLGGALVLNRRRRRVASAE